MPVAQLQPLPPPPPQQQQQCYGKPPGLYYYYYNYYSIEPTTYDITWQHQNETNTGHINGAHITNAIHANQPPLPHLVNCHIIPRGGKNGPNNMSGVIWALCNFLNIYNNTD